MSDSVRPHRQQPTRLPCPWDSPGKNSGVGCHFLLQCMQVKSESEVTLVCSKLWLLPVGLASPWLDRKMHPRSNFYSWLHIFRASSESESEVAQSCPTLSDPMDCSLPGSPIHGIFQARVLEWGAIAFSKYPKVVSTITTTTKI